MGFCDDSIVSRCRQYRRFGVDYITFKLTYILKMQLVSTIFGNNILRVMVLSLLIIHTGPSAFV